MIECRFCGAKEGPHEVWCPGLLTHLEIQAATPSSGVTEGKAESGECPCVKYGLADVQAWWMRDGATFTCQCGSRWRYTNRPEPWGDHVYSWVPQPPAPADDAATVLAGLRVEMVALLRMVSAGRREYSVNAPEHTAETLRVESNAYENAARIVEGDQHMVRALLPSWRWPEAAQQRLAERGRGGGSDG